MGITVEAVGRRTVEVLAAAVGWLAALYLFLELLPLLPVSPGINLIFLPAGIRLFLIIVLQGWGAIGIFIGDQIWHLHDHDVMSPADSIGLSLIGALVPYAVWRIYCHGAGIDRQLRALKLKNVLTLAFYSSVASPLAFNLYFALTQAKPWAEFGRNLWAMIAGDAAGILVVLGATTLAVRGWRRLPQN